MLALQLKRLLRSKQIAQGVKEQPSRILVCLARVASAHYVIYVLGEMREEDKEYCNKLSFIVPSKLFLLPPVSLYLLASPPIQSATVVNKLVSEI